MNRLMQPRPVRTNARAAASAVRTVGSATGALTMVTHPPGASTPILTEPPEAGFIMEAAATLAELQVRHQPPVTPRPALPLIPSADLSTVDGLVGLEQMLRSVRPVQRESRPMPPIRYSALASPKMARPQVELPRCEPAWPASLGLLFFVEGLDHVSTSPAVTTGPWEFSDGAPALPAAQPETSRPIAHKSIPPRRPERPFELARVPEIGVENLLAQPVLSPPRLRIHLPKPVLNPFRPRYAFAPKTAAKAAAVEEPKANAAAVAAGVKPATGPEAKQESKRTVQPEAKSEPKPEAKQESKPIAKWEPKPEVTPQGKAEPKPAAKPEPKSEARSEPKPEAKPDRKPEAKVEPKAEAKAEPKAPAAKAEPKPETKPEPKPAPAKEREKEATTFAVPSFGGQADIELEPEGFFARIPGWQKAAAAIAVVCIAVAAWAIPAIKGYSPKVTSLPTAAAAPPAALGLQSWETEAATDTTGLARHRTISQYKPGRGKRDYILEFSGQIEQRAIGWVFRMKDSKNYYCLKVELNGDGPNAKAQLVRFAVIDGEEQPHKLVPLKENLQSSKPVKIRFDVRGQNFATQLNGRPVDVWIDNRIADGTVGFTNESGERAVINTVKVSY